MTGSANRTLSRCIETQSQTTLFMDTTSVLVQFCQGQPSFVRVYRYPDFAGPGSALANKSFYKADKCDMIWNNKGANYCHSKRHRHVHLSHVFCASEIVAKEVSCKNNRQMERHVSFHGANVVLPMRRSNSVSHV